MGLVALHMSSIDVDAVDAVEDDSTADDTTESNHDHAVDVEIVDDATTLPESVDAPEYVLYGGKGGVGKTTMAAATAVASATAGTDTLVVSTDPAHSLSDTFDTDIPPEPARIRDDIPLYAAEIDPDSVAAGPFAGGEGMIYLIISAEMKTPQRDLVNQNLVLRPGLVATQVRRLECHLVISMKWMTCLEGSWVQLAAREQCLARMKQQQCNNYSNIWMTLDSTALSSIPHQLDIHFDYSNFQS
jgi:arsenite efflux ATP-binding protein ArsA (TC 3.A.4.1.1)